MRTRTILIVSIALCLGFAAAVPAARALAEGVEVRFDLTDPQGGKFQLESTIAFTSTRDHVSDVPALTPAFLGAEIYLASPDFVDSDPEKWSLTNFRRLTDNDSADGFASLSPDGKKIVFDSTRLTGCPTCPYAGSVNRSDLFLMDSDGTEQTL